MNSYWPDGYQRVEQETCSSVSYLVCDICRAKIEDGYNWKMVDGERVETHYYQDHTNWHNRLVLS